MNGWGRESLDTVWLPKWNHLIKDFINIVTI